MAEGNEWTEWHITPRGCEQGSTRVDFAGITKVERPTDTATTERYSEVQTSMYDKVDRDARTVWRCDDEQRIKQLLHEFGPCPRQL